MIVKDIPCVSLRGGYLESPAEQATIPSSTGPAILVVSKGPRRQFRFCWWYRSSHGTDFDMSETAGPDVAHNPPKVAQNYGPVAFEDFF